MIKNDSSEPINFVESIFAYLSPFSAHRIEIWGDTFPTVEHAYQAARLKPGPEREEIKSAGSPKEAWRLAQTFKGRPEIQAENFNKDAVMEELFRAKLAQHHDIAEILKSSRGHELQKVITTDSYWGTGADGKGENKMGKIWMKIRDEL